MPIKTLKSFQTAAIDSAVEVFSHVKTLLDAAGSEAQSRAVAIHDNGYLLIEAPTGAGKTLMAGYIVERMSALDDVVWFWFAPFKGVVDQSAAFLREQFAGLKLRTLSEDRSPASTRKGDVFVTTWQTVATRVKDRRSVRKTGEQNPSIDDLILSLREQGLRIGVVVDEAHHGFHGETQAAEFFRGVLQPEYTILVTATPDDADLEDLKKRMKIGHIHRIGVSRPDAVDAGLIKHGIKCVAWKADEGNEGLIDFERVALAEGAAVHRVLKAELVKAGIPLVPLMLVQVASNDRSVERAKERLIALGFTDAQIAVHTADEPDAGLLALANDESREVLIFKMAVALGFDAPRAWTLVSMRAGRDADFGVQLVGRILRVHRRLQGRNVPETLRYGYVLLADMESQGGIDAAGQRINRLQTEYARLSPATVIVRIGNQDQVQMLGRDGQTRFFSVPPTGAVWTPAPIRAETGGQAGAGLFCPSFADSTGDDASQTLRKPLAMSGEDTTTSKYSYPLRKDVPTRFKTQEGGGVDDTTEEECARYFTVDANTLVDLLIKSDKVKYQKRTLEIFTQAVQMDFAYTPPSAEQMRRTAQHELLRSDIFHPKELREALERRLQVTLLDRGVEDAADRKILAGYLDLLLSMRPTILRAAQRAALARESGLKEAAPLPDAIQSDEPLPTSLRNVYGVRPPDLNTWEKEFADLFDADPTGTVLWWHRNPVNKSWSINVLLENGHGFYPDFIVGIRNRPTEEHGLLLDPKERFQQSSELPKILAEHAGYGRVLIVSKDPNDRWAMVERHAGTAVLGAPFKIASAAAY